LKDSAAEAAMHEDIKYFRDERIRRGVKLREVAAALEIDPTYLSHIESGRRRVTPTIIAGYAQALGLSSADIPLSSAKIANPVVARILCLLQTFKPYTLKFIKSAIRGTKHANSASSLRAYIERTPEDLKLFCDKVLSSSRARTSRHAIESGDTLIFIWNSLREYAGTLAHVRYSTIVAHCLGKGAEFHHYFVPAGQDRSLEETVWLLRRQLKTLLFKSRVSFDAIPMLNYGLYPIDFFVLANKIADIRFATTSFNAKEGMIVDADVKPATAYIRKIATHREQRVSVFRGEGEVEKFLDAYCSTENTSGLRYLSQQLLGSHTRPPDDYAKGTSWWNRYSSLSERYGLNINMERLAANRSRAHSLILQRMANFPVKQICSRNQLEKWAAQPDLHVPFSTMDYADRSERVARINYALYLLRNFEKYFGIAVIDDKEGEQLGWSPESHERTVRWLVQGKDKVILETSIENDFESTDHDNASELQYNKIRKADGQNQLQVQVIIQNESIAQAFQRHFDGVWSNLKKDSVDRQAVVEYFENLKNRIK
jgi:transcriptional regulator with XRE-family HTH domain